MGSASESSVKDGGFRERRLTTESVTRHVREDSRCQSTSEPFQTLPFPNDPERVSHSPRFPDLGIVRSTSSLEKGLAHVERRCHGGSDGSSNSSCGDMGEGRVDS